jgi:hypothetical protein
VKCKVTPIENGKALREGFFEGTAAGHPVVGKCFIAFGPSLDGDPGKERFFRTSVVQEVTEEPFGFTVRTMNSVYRVEVIGQESL